MKSEPILKVVELTKHFGGIKALNKVSFDLHEGEILGIIGPNGSGKTTLVNALEDLADGRSPASGIPTGLTPRAVIPVDLYGLPADYERIAVVTDLKGYLEPCGCTTDPLGDLARTAKLIASAAASGPVICSLGELAAASTEDASADALCACMRSWSVSRPLRNTQALNALMVGPAVRRKP